MVAFLFPALGGRHALPCPHLEIRPRIVFDPPCEGAPAISALKHTGEGIGPSYLLPRFVVVLIHPAPWAGFFPPDFVRLLEDLLGDNRLMVVLQIELVRFAEIRKPSFGYRINRERLPQEDVPLVFLISDDSENTAAPPFEASALGFVPELLELSGDDCRAGTFNVSSKNVANRFGLLFIYGQSLRLRIVIVTKASLEAD